MGCDEQFDGLYEEGKTKRVQPKVPQGNTDQLARIADALERIATVLEEAQDNRGRLAVDVVGVVAAG